MRVRIERLKARIKEDVARIVAYELADPRLRFGSVTRVELTEDLRHAKIFVSCLGSASDRRTFLRALESARGLIQSRIASHMRTRVTPLIAFEYDESVERSIRLSKLIDQAVAEDDARRAARGEAVPRATAADLAKEEE